MTECELSWYNQEISILKHDPLVSQYSLEDMYQTPDMQW
jgi:hypothetical protein